MSEAIKKDWWKSAAEDAVTDLKTKSALDRVVIRQISVLPKKHRKKPDPKHVSDRHFPVTYWCELYNFEADTVRGWCRTNELEARWIKGEYRISERAMHAFLEEQEKKRG